MTPIRVTHMVPADAPNPDAIPTPEQLIRELAGRVFELERRVAELESQAEEERTYRLEQNER